MGLLNIPRIPRGASLEEAVNIYNMAIEEMEHRINGFLQSSNIQEVGGWKVSQTELKSKDNDVGMSTEDTAGDDVRYWSGGTDKNTAPWRVTKGGKMTATGAVIESSSGYPKVVMDPEGNFFVAYKDANNYVGLFPVFGGGAPALAAVTNGIDAYDLSASETEVVLKTAAKDLILETDIQGNVKLIPALGYFVTVPGWEYFQNAGTGEDLLTALLNLQSSIDDLTAALAGKATAGASTSTDGSHNHGIPDGTVLMVNGGGTVTFVSSGSHSHTQT